MRLLVGAIGAPEAALLAASISAFVSLVVAGISWAAQRSQFDRKMIAEEERLSQQLANERERWQLEFQAARTGDQAERVARLWLTNPKWKLRTFTEIKRRLGGFDDDDLRRILVRAGAIRFYGTNQTRQEMWGLLERDDVRLLLELESEAEAEGVEGPSAIIMG